MKNGWVFLRETDGTGLSARGKDLYQLKRLHASGLEGLGFVLYYSFECTVHGSCPSKGLVLHGIVLQAKGVPAFGLDLIHVVLIQY
jgi:hypothetical protein